MVELRMPYTCSKARKISDDLKWGNKLGGSHDDHVGVQQVAAMHHAKYDRERIPDGVPPMEIRNIREGQKPAILKK